jgi:hypothetical protein
LVKRDTNEGFAEKGGIARSVATRQSYHIRDGVIPLLRIVNNTEDVAGVGKSAIYQWEKDKKKDKKCTGNDFYYSL